MTEFNWTDEMRVPDSIEPIRAARAWRVSPYVGGVRGLRSTGVSESWPTGVMKADCIKSTGSILSAMVFASYATGGNKETQSDKPHTAPGLECACGIWGLADPVRLAAYDFGTAAEPLIYGVIEMWGRVICGSYGWRAEYARPVAIVQRNRRRVRSVERECAASYGGLGLEPAWPTLSSLTPAPEWDRVLPEGADA